MVVLRQYLKKIWKFRNGSKAYNASDFAKALGDPDLNLKLAYDELLLGKPKSFLSKIIETIYFVSMETDEGRSLRFNVVYSSQFADKVKDSIYTDELPFRYWRFEQPKPFNKKELRKLSVCNPETSAIWIGLSRDLATDSTILTAEVELEIKGFVLLGEKWLGSVYGFSDGYSHNLEPLVIRAEGPGYLDVYLGSKLSASLKSGSIFLSLPNWVNNLNVLNPLVKDGFASFLGKIFYPEVEDVHNQLYLREYYYHSVLFSIVNAIQLMQHGGVLIFTKRSGREHVSSLLKVKYTMDQSEQSLHELFLKYLNTRYELVEVSRWFEQNKTEPGAKEKCDALIYKSVIARQRLTECSRFVGGLASMDGAILMDTSFNIFGFSSEINLSAIGHEMSDKQILKISGPLVDMNELNKAQPLNPEFYGMRHRSAIQLSLALENAAIFVVSQDGNVSLLWDQKGQHYFWENFETKNMPFALYDTLSESLEEGLIRQSD